MVLHQIQKLSKVDEAVPVLQQRIINHQASVCFWSGPASLDESPFDIEHDRHCGANMVADVKIACAELSIKVNDPCKGGKEDGHRVAFDLHKSCAVVGRNNGPGVPV